MRYTTFDLDNTKKYIIYCNLNGDETPEDIYNELKKEVLDLCYERASKRRENYRQRDKNEV